MELCYLFLVMSLMLLGHFSTFLITSNTELLDARGAAASEDIKQYLDAMIGGIDCTTSN